MNKMLSLSFMNSSRVGTLLHNSLKILKMNAIFCTKSKEDCGFSQLEYEKMSDHTLITLADVFEDLYDRYPLSDEYDVEFASGVLKVNLGPDVGTYVINRQSFNKQLWLSSPISGAKRYDFMPSKRAWLYKYDTQSLHELLSKEISEIIGDEVKFEYTDVDI